MKAKAQLGYSKADRLYRLLIATLVLVAFCAQQIASAQAPADASQEAPLLAASSGAEMPEAAPARSAGTYAAKSAVWWNRLDQQFAGSLRSRNTGIREGALRNTIHFATQYGEQITFEKSVPELLRIYETDRNEAHRMMALSALHAIGNKYAMQRLAQVVQHEKPGRLRHCTLAALADYLENGKK